jgi:hypothetical protein
MLLIELPTISLKYLSFINEFSIFPLFPSSHAKFILDIAPTGNDKPKVTPMLLISPPLIKYGKLLYIIPVLYVTLLR